MFDRESRPTMRESVVESADSAVQWADYWSRPTGNWPSGYGPLGAYDEVPNLACHFLSCPISLKFPY